MISGVKLSVVVPQAIGISLHNLRIFKVVYMNFHMFLGMVKETSKEKKWSKGSKESAEGQGMPYKCDSPRVVKSAIIVVFMLTIIFGMAGH